MTSPPTLRRRAARRAARVRTRWQQDLLRSDAARVDVGRSLVVRVLADPPDAHDRTTVVTSRRFSPSAVVRNRVRRVLRSVLQPLRKRQSPAWILVIPRRKALNVTPEQVRAELRCQLDRLGVRPAEPTEHRAVRTPEVMG